MNTLVNQRRRMARLFFAGALAISTAVAAEPRPGSPEMPMQYFGPALVDQESQDGHLRYCPGVQNIEISRANRKRSSETADNHDPLAYTYQHHMDLACWKGRYYAAWGVCVKDEDVLPCRQVYSTSTNGFDWTEPKDLYPAGASWYMRFYFYRASNDRMLAFGIGPDGGDKMKEDKKATMLVREITAGHQLGPIYTLLRPGTNFPPSFETSADAGFVAACREAAHNHPLLEQQDYGVLLGDEKMKWHDKKNWPGKKMTSSNGNWPFGKAMCFFHRQDGTLVGLSKLGFATLSADQGLTWSFPVVPPGIITGGAKIWGQKLPDDRYALIFDPQAFNAGGRRFPLIIETGDDGITFHDMRLIHGEVPPQRYKGHAKNTGPQYQRGVAEWSGDVPTLDPSSIWIIYSMNKEDIWMSRIPVPALPDETKPVHDTFDELPEGRRVPGWNTYSPIWAPVSVAKDSSGNGFLQLQDRDPVDYARAIRAFPPSTAVDVKFRVAAAQADRGRLEIDLLGLNGARPVQLVMNNSGELQAMNNGSLANTGKYGADKWTDIGLKVKDGKFTLTRDGKAVLSDAPFAEASPMVYAISFRTGEYRDKAPRPAEQDLAKSDEPVPAVTYRVDDVVTSNHTLFHDASLAAAKSQ